MDAPLSVSRFPQAFTPARRSSAERWRETARLSLLLHIALLLVLIETENASAKQSFSVKPPPRWVEPLSPADLSAGQSSGGVTYLLGDYQFNVTDTTVEKYYHQVKRVDSASGLESISQLEFDFEPSYQSLIIHYIRIARGKALINALRPREINVIQQETELRERLYNGTLTALAILDDVRVGDVIEYAYSVNGNNPVMGGRYADNFYLGIGRPVEHVRLRLLWLTNRKLYYRQENTDAYPLIREGRGETEYVWEQKQVAAVETSADAPSWLNQHPTIHLSDFSDWGDVVRWAMPLYRLTTSLDPALIKQIEEWRDRWDSDERRLIAALRFVQDEVRYLGIEIGPNSHLPSQPSLVFRRRFGDCKDKSLLLATILNRLGIQSYTALVNSESGRRLQRALPSPYAFDHVIVQVNLDGLAYWIDSTISFQRGALRYRYNPGYERALVVREGNTALEEIPLSTTDDPSITVKERYTVNEDGTAMLESVTTYRSKDADEIRHLLAEQSVSEYGKNCVKYYSEIFSSVEAEAEPQISDDEETNTIVIIERYLIPSFWKEGKRDLFAGQIYENLSKPSKSQSNVPVSLSFPVNVSHTIELRLPEPLGLRNSSGAESNDVISFQHSRRFGDKTAIFDYRIQTLRDHVPAELLTNYVKVLERIEQNIGFTLRRDALGARSPGRGVIAFLLIMALTALLVFGVVKAIIHTINRRNRQTPKVAPGTRPETAIRISQEDDLSGRLADFHCLCGKQYYKQDSEIERTGAMFDGRRLIVVGLSCEACGRRRDVYFAPLQASH